jgi:hypothetical protein
MKDGKNVEMVTSDNNFTNTNTKRSTAVVDEVSEVGRMDIHLAVMVAT